MKCHFSWLMSHAIEQGSRARMLTKTADKIRNCREVERFCYLGYRLPGINEQILGSFHYFISYILFDADIQCRTDQLIQIIRSDAKLFRIKLYGMFAFCIFIDQPDETPYVGIPGFVLFVICRKRLISAVEQHECFVEQRPKHMHVIGLIRVYFFFDILEK